MAEPPNSEYIYDWNQASPPAIAPGTRVLLNDETLRDGLQNPSVYDPSIEEKIEILHLMESLGIDSVKMCIRDRPGPQGRVVDHAEVGIADGGIRGAKHRAVESVLGLQAQLQFHGFVFVGEDEIFAD